MLTQHSTLHHSSKGNAVPKISAALGREVLNVVGAEHANQAQRRLLEAGVKVTRDGSVSHTAEAADEYDASRWSSDITTQDLAAGALVAEDMVDSQTRSNYSSQPKKLVSRIWKHIDSLDAARLHARLPETSQRTLLAAGGQGAGAPWLQLPTRPAEFWPNTHWRIATQLRLSAAEAPRGAVCAIPARSEDGG